MSNDDFDPFGEKIKTPALSFKDEPIGTVKYIDVSEPAKVLQQRDYDTAELDFWKNKDGTQGNPKMAGVLNGIDQDGDPVSLWAPIPGDLQAKLVEAQKALGRQIGNGNVVDRLHVKLIARPPAKNPKYTKNEYAVKVEPRGPKPVAAADDPWASTSASASASAFTEEPPF